RVGPVEALEHPLGLLGGEPRPVIDHLDGGPRAAVHGPRPGPGPARAAARGRPSRDAPPPRTATGPPAGVWARALLTRLARTWRSRWSSPSTTSAFPLSPSSPPRTTSTRPPGATARASLTASAARASR